MGQTLKQIAAKLRDADKKVQLVYAFNASGKTRLSREFRELIDPKTDDQDANHRPKVLYYNAFTEDLFYWDNDLKDDVQRKLLIQPNRFTQLIFDTLKTFGIDDAIVKRFQHYANEKLTPRFAPDFSEVAFSLDTGDDNNIDHVKISKGEERTFVWSVFHCLLDQVLSTRSISELDQRDTAHFNDLKYIFIDDPVSSLDENHLIQLAVDVAGLIKKSDSDNGLRFIITTHSPLFFNVLFNELQLARKQDSTRMLTRLDDGTFSLETKNGDSNKSFSYHLYLKQALEQAIAANKIERFHFTLLRNLYEKTSSFLGYPQWSQLLPEDQKLYLNRIIQFTSHSTLSNEAVAEPTPQEKQTVKLLLEHLRNNYGYWREEASNG